MIIEKKGTRQFGNFSESELYSKSTDAPDYHYLADKVIEASNIIRDYFGVPMTPNSTFRTKLNEIMLNSFGSYNAHMDGDAIDIDFDGRDPEYMPKVYDDIINQGTLWHLLREAGITGFGLYPGWFHIDCRSEGSLTPHQDEYGKYAIWDHVKKKV